jgi:hypothetical protein
MTGIEILENMGFVFNYVFQNVFFTLAGLMILYTIILAIYTLIIKR